MFVFYLCLPHIYNDLHCIVFPPGALEGRARESSFTLVTPEGKRRREGKGRRGGGGGGTKGEDREREREGGYYIK